MESCKFVERSTPSKAEIYLEAWRKIDRFCGIASCTIYCGHRYKLNWHLKP